VVSGSTKVDLQLTFDLRFRPESECAHVRVLLNREGRPSGEALAEFETEELAEAALTKNRQYMRDRFVILTAQY